MNNKTCGECKHFSYSDEGRCMDDEWTFRDSDACEKFKPKVVTNGDRIRQMSNDELARDVLRDVYLEEKFQKSFSEILHRADTAEKRG